LYPLSCPNFTEPGKDSQTVHLRAREGSRQIGVGRRFLLSSPTSYAAARLVWSSLFPPFPSTSSRQSQSFFRLCVEHFQACSSSPASRQQPSSAPPPYFFPLSLLGLRIFWLMEVDLRFPEDLSVRDLLPSSRFPRRRVLRDATASGPCQHHPFCQKTVQSRNSRSPGGVNSSSFEADMALFIFSFAQLLALASRNIS